MWRPAGVFDLVKGSDCFGFGQERARCRGTRYIWSSEYEEGQCSKDADPHHQPGCRHLRLVLKVSDEYM